jgi:hypothetical protein
MCDPPDKIKNAEKQEKHNIKKLQTLSNSMQTADVPWELV